MNYTAHPSTLNDGEVSFKEKQYLLPKYQKIARDNIGAVDTEKVLELIKEHGGEGGGSETKYDLWSGSQVVIGSNATTSTDGVSLQLTNIPTGITTFKKLVIRTRHKQGTSQYCPTFEPIILHDMPVVSGRQYRAATLAASSRATNLTNVDDGIVWNLEFRTTSSGKLQCICKGGLASDYSYGVTRVSSNNPELPSDYCCIYSVEGYV